MKTKSKTKQAKLDVHQALSSLEPCASESPSGTLYLAIH